MLTGDCSNAVTVFSTCVVFAAGGGDRFGDREGGDREGRSERRGGWGDRDRSEGGGSQASDDGPSRADMADDWGASRKFTPSSGADDRRVGGGGFGGGGFGDRDREPRRGGFGDRWGHRLLMSMAGSDCRLAAHSQHCEPHRAASACVRARNMCDPPGVLLQHASTVFVRRGRDRDGDVEDDGPSRADTSDNWGMNRAPLPAEPARSGSAFGERRSGGGFADRDSFGSGR